jgi:hypothetical protein
MGLLSPDPKKPGSVLSFSALPTALALVSLIVLAGILIPNSVWVGGWGRVSPPSNMTQLLAAAASQLSREAAAERRRAVETLVAYTRMCPNYASLVVPELVGALDDDAPRVKGAAIIGLGELGAHADTAVAELQGLGERQIPHMDHLIVEAIGRIKSGSTWEALDGCDPPSPTEFEEEKQEWLGQHPPEPRWDE